jgi:hypothetical protein
MISRIFNTKKDQNRLDEHVVWGIWAPRRLQFIFKMLASDLRVPISVLVGHILRQWLADNYETLTNDKQKKLEFADYLAKEDWSSEGED